MNSLIDSIVYYDCLTPLMGADYYETRYKERVLCNIAKRARDPGYGLTLRLLVRRGSLRRFGLTVELGFEIIDY